MRIMINLLENKAKLAIVCAYLVQQYGLIDL